MKQKKSNFPKIKKAKKIARRIGSNINWYFDEQVKQIKHHSY